MKKYIELTFVMILIVLLSGCKNKEVVTTCNMTSNQSPSEYITKSTYEIYSRKEIVDKVIIQEEIISKNNTILAYFEKQLNDHYKVNNDTYGGYTYEVTNKEGKVISKVLIDYSKMDLNKFIEDNSSMKPYINKDNNMTLSGIKIMYESIGAACK